MEILSSRFDGFIPVDAVIKLVLENEKWFRDGPPHWQISAGKPWQRPSQTAAEARTQRIKTEDLLSRYASSGYTLGISIHSDIWQTIRSLQRCHPGLRCGSGSCPECIRALQRWFVENVHNAAKTLLKNKRELILLSLVPDYAATLATNPILHWEKVKTKLCQDMATVGIQWAIGGSDFSINIDKVNGADPVLQGQFWLLIEKPKGGNRSNDLKRLINSSGKIKRPLKKYNSTGSYAQLAYGIKNEFIERESLIKTPSPNSGRNPHLNTRGKKLHTEFWLNLMASLHRIGLEGRLIDHNALI